VNVLRCPAICDTVAWSVDGSRIFYNSRTTHLDARLWSVARTGGGPALVFKDDVQLLAAAFSTAGKRLAILRVVKRPDGAGSMYGLFLSEPPGAEPVRFEAFPLRNLITPTRIAWSADATRLLVSSSNPALIHVVSLAANTVKEVPFDDPLDISWGVDPRLAVVARPSQSSTRAGLQWFDTETGRLTPLISSESILSYPAVSPDGSRVAYTTGDIDYDLVAIPLDGSPIQPSGCQRRAAP
jgi:dipeptidyl aminopeptidase/acylaminoacyl peptidase